jgi:glycosyltransferase involved in cell wall biosynthesis
MSSYLLSDLPAPPNHKKGWPWTKQSASMSQSRSNSESWPTISVITPSYNQGEFIEETIRSVLLQGYPNLEYIIIDGGSDDQTLDIIQKYDPWIHKWVSEPDDGQAHAINKGLKQATGSIHGWINSDDFYVPGALATVARSLRTNDCDAVSGGRLLVDRDSNVTGWSIPPSKNPEDGGNPWAQDSTFWRSYIYERVGYLDESYSFAMDYEFFLRVNSQFDIKDSNDLIGCFRCYPENKSSRHHATIGRSEAEKAWKENLEAPVDILHTGRVPSRLRHWFFFAKHLRRLAIPYLANKLNHLI